ncbi:cytochrome P450 family protein [Streptomyces pacificus]|uniref:Cytochrome P450 n=1 Tax=Streptomyces pacificus TaxID=2705029 RepID=A0A6A0APB8_9ACTN|nr:cytochrome P450 [Streptomyces pacificus]GFH34829.1 cytochrome P450 [Streptomyces pacificus]
MVTADLGAYGPGFFTDPYPYYARLREAGPVHEIVLADGDRFWLIVGYDEARAALSDPRLAKSLAPPSEDERHVLITDPPDHTRLRRLVSREFTARRVEAMRPRLQEITDGLLDEMAAGRRRADLVSSLASPLPITVLCELLGVPLADRDDFRGWTERVLVPEEPGTIAWWKSRGFAQAGMALTDYLKNLIEDKRRSAPTGDLISSLLRTTAEDNDRLSAAELHSMVFILIVAGHETTANLITNGVRALLANPAQLAALRADPEGRIDQTIEEALRYDGPVETSTKRFTTETVSYGATRIPPGETVLVSIAAAGRDPARFERPDTFDIHRGTAGSRQGHVAFGHGIHFCLGAGLARMESRVALLTLLRRCPDLALDADPAGLDWLPGIRVRGVRSLPVRW